MVLSNKDMIVGDIKGMNKGVLTIETDYSDSDFKIEWDGISYIRTETTFLISLEDGSRYNGVLRYSDVTGGIEILDSDLGTFDVSANQIVYLNAFEDDFWHRLSASVDLNYSFTRANNFRQAGANAQLGYVASKWSSGATFSLVTSSQDDAEDTRRIDGGVNFRWFLPKAWYVGLNASFLSNTEQKLNLRSNLKAGLGKFLIRTNATYLGAEAGLSYVLENFSNDDPDRSSMEAYVGAEFNLYDIGDLSLLTNGVVYPGITESGRVRADLGFNLKYDLPLDVYIKFGTTANYDNQAVEGASDWDYVLQFGVGWELDN